MSALVTKLVLLAVLLIAGWHLTTAVQHRVTSAVTSQIQAVDCAAGSGCATWTPTP